MKIPYLFLVLLVGTINLLHADDEITQEQARLWVEQGVILPLEQILSANQASLDGRILDVELEREDGILVYEIKLLNAQGRKYELYLDAVTGQKIKEEED